MLRGTPTRHALALLAAVAGTAALATPAHADRVTIGSDLSAPATVALSDPNDVVFWPSEQPGSVDVPVKGQAIIMEMKGGTVQSSGGPLNGDAKYDILHFMVLRPTGGGWQVKWTSRDLKAPIIGKNGVGENTVTPYTAGAHNPLCVEPGDRIAMAEVGGFDGGNGIVLPHFGNGLPYQVFGAVPSSTTHVFAAGGMIHTDDVFGKSRTAQRAGTELLLRVTIGTGPSARYTCGGSAPTDSDPGLLAEEPAQPPASPGGGSGSSGPKVLVPMASPLLKSRRLDKKGRVPINLTCRATGTDCSGTIELRAHKKRIGHRTYALARGASGVFTVKLTKTGRHYVKVASSKELRTAVVVLADGGRKAGGTFNIRPAKHHKHHKGHKK